MVVDDSHPHPTVVRVQPGALTSIALVHHSPAPGAQPALPTLTSLHSSRAQHMPRLPSSCAHAHQHASGTVSGCWARVHMTHGLHRTRFGRPVLPQSLERTPPLGRFSDFLRRAADQEARRRGGLFRRGLRLGARTVHQLHREPLRCTAPSNPVSNIPLSHTLSLRRPPRLAPTSGVRISRFLPACVRRKQAQDPSSPSRTGGGTAGSCRCAPRPDALGWALAQPRRSRLLARRRTVRDSLNGIRRARAILMLSRHELYHRALHFGCTFGLTCRGPWMCVVVVSCRASESVVV